MPLMIISTPNRVSPFTANVCEWRETQALARSIARGVQSGAVTKLTSGNSSSQSTTRLGQMAGGHPTRACRALRPLLVSLAEEEQAAHELQCTILSAGAQPRALASSPPLKAAERTASLTRRLSVSVRGHRPAHVSPIRGLVWRQQTATGEATCGDRLPRFGESLAPTYRGRRRSAIGSSAGRGLASGCRLAQMA